MGAVRDVAGLDDAARVALPEPRQRIAAGTVDAGKAEDVDLDSASPSRLDPARFVGEPRQPPLRAGQRRARLADPGAEMLAVNADGRVIDNAPERRRSRDRRRKTALRRLSCAARRNRNDDRLGPLQRLLDAGVGPRAVVYVSLDAFAAKRGDALLRAHGSARLDRRHPPDERLRAIAEAEEEDFHLALPKWTFCCVTRRTLARPSG